MARNTNKRGGEGVSRMDRAEDFFAQQMFCKNVAKKVAAILAENAATVKEMKKIFDYTEDELTVRFHSSSDAPLHQDRKDSDQQ